MLVCIFFLNVDFQLSELILAGSQVDYELQLNKKLNYTGSLSIWSNLSFGVEHDHDHILAINCSNTNNFIKYDEELIKK